jgi:uncharacterized protein YgbK (DUF1537 family)
MQRRVLIVADDLTGAADAAVTFRAAGWRAFVAMDPHANTARWPVAALSTESRSLGAQEAADAVGLAVFLAQPQGCLVLKKIDSLLRGSVVAETTAALQASGAELALVAPALPAQRRTTMDARVFVDGAPLSSVGRALDPLAPPLSGDLRALFTAAGGATCLPLELVRCGADAVAEALRRASTPVVLADAESDSDLDNLAHGMLLAGKQVVPCGSSGLAAALARALPPPAPFQAANATMRLACHRVLVVVGSQSAVAAGQVAHLEGATGDAVRIDAAALVGHTDASLAAARDAAIHCLRSRPVAAVVLTDLAHLCNAKVPARELRRMESLVASALARLAADVVRGVEVHGLVLSGGSTAAAVLRAIGVSGLDVQGEVMPGIPASLAVGGRLDGAVVVTKAGAFGAADALTYAARHLVGSDE